MSDETLEERMDKLTNAIRLSEECVKAIARTLYEIGLAKSGRQAEEFALEVSLIRLEGPRRPSH
jgi:hypothetical protein